MNLGLLLKVFIAALYIIMGVLILIFKFDIFLDNFWYRIGFGVLLMCYGGFRMYSALTSIQKES
ncbi:MAG: hypothetical protein U0V72_12295 [Cytophagales bacterium]